MDTVFHDDFSREVWQTTYKHHKDNTIDDTLKRVALAVSSVEKTEELKQKWKGEFYKLLTGFKLCPGGRILANAGTNWNGVTLMNCFVGPKPKYDQDSLEGILNVLIAQAQTLKSEGGWGMNFSFIRPRGSFINGIGVESPGSVKYMELFNKSSDVITSGSGKKANTKEAKGKIRKGAMMAVLDVWHPDIEEFITAKLTQGRLDKFNISVNCGDDFMFRVSRINKINWLLTQESIKNSEHNRVKLEEERETLETWGLIFPDTKYPAYKEEWDGNIALWQEKRYPVKVHKIVKVSELWDKIMQSTYTRNDPGVLFLDKANLTHCWNYGGKEAFIAATNPCGEQCLPFGAVCNLASLNLTQFVNRDGSFDFDRLSTAVVVAVRFLDNVNDLTLAPLPQYAESIKKRRRIGLGVMGWGSALYMMKIRFASQEAETLKAQIMQKITWIAIQASINLAKEKGMFEGCDPIRHSRQPFFKQIGLDKAPAILADMAEYGIRNSALFSVQPTGNTSILCNVVSGGLEPVFLHEYIRTVIVNSCPEHLLPVICKYWEGEFKETSMFKFTKEGDETILRGVDQDGTIYKIDKNRGLTKEVPCTDYGVAFLKETKEWNPKADYAVTTSNLSVEEHVKDMKGFGRWIDSSMSKTVNLPNDYSYESFKNLYLEAYKTGYLKGITTYREGTMTTVLSAAKKNTIPKTIAPKRPTSINAELHHFVIDKHKYYVVVGLYGDENEPYEVFTGINETKKEIYIPKKVKTGHLVKKARGKYMFIGDDNEEYELTNGHSNETATALSRMISCALRHGSDISFIVHQLEKTEGPIISFSKVLARTLKKYIKDGTCISGEECPECKSKLVRKEGCANCPQCGYSKCT